MPLEKFSNRPKGSSAARANKDKGTINLCNNSNSDPKVDSTLIRSPISRALSQIPACARVPPTPAMLSFTYPHRAC